MNRLSHRLRKLEAAAPRPMASALAAASAAFVDRVEALSLQAPTGAADLRGFRDAMLATRDPVIIGAFINMDAADPFL